MSPERLRAQLHLGDLTCTLCDGGVATALAGSWPHRFGPEAFVGPARTVRTAHGELVPIERGIDALQPGEVLAIASGSDAAVWGGRLTGLALARGAAAVVVDGLVRDVPELREAGLAVVARGITPQRSEAARGGTGTGAVVDPIRIGRASVNAGDLLVGDANGLVVVPAERLEAAAAILEERSARGAT